VEHGVAVWTDRCEVIYGIDHVGLANLGEWHRVVYMDKAFANCSILCHEIKTANPAEKPMVLNRFCPSIMVTLVSIYCKRSIDPVLAEA